MSRFTDMPTEDIVAMSGWNEDTVLSLYANFVAQRNLEDEFAAFCRAQAEEELTDDERLEDEEAAWEEAGGPICPQCGVPYKGVWNHAHKMDCSIGRTPLSRIDELPDELPPGEYKERVRRYVSEIPVGEDE